MLTHDYHSNNDDGLNRATLRTFSQKKRPILDNEHVRQDGPLGLGQDGPGPSCPSPIIMHCAFRWHRFFLFFSSVDMIIKHVEMLYGVLHKIACQACKQHGCIVIFLVDQSWLWSAVAQLLNAWLAIERARVRIPLCYRFEVWAFLFSSRRLSRPSCINEYLAIDSGGNVSGLVVAHNCCMTRMLPGEAKLVSEWTGVPGRAKV